MDEQRGFFSVEALCRVLQVSRSGYYAWRKRKPPARTLDEERLRQEVHRAHAGSKRRYGSPRVFRELRARGLRCSENRVARVMRQEGLRARGARRFKATTNSGHSFPVALNHLNRRFSVGQANAAWAGDITCIWTREGWLYLAVVIDLCSRRVVGWSMQERMEAGLVTGALRMALAYRRPGAGLLCHSDRGGQYASQAYQRLLSEHGLVCSMSRKGDCWDNAVAESFFATLKRELVHGRDYRTRAEARGEVFEYIEVFYNRNRRHSSLGYRSPAEFEQEPRPTAALVPLN